MPMPGGRPGLLARLARTLRARMSGVVPGDDLTGLPGHGALVRALRARLLDPGGPGSFAVAVLDIDRLREVNAVFGYEAGDRLLAELAAALRRREVGPAFRISGDRFALLLEDPRPTPAVGELVEELRAGLSGPWKAGGAELEVQLSAGLALYPRHGREAEALLRAAELALDAAKARGGARTVVFEPEIDAGLRRRKLLEAALRRAIRERAFTLHFQPQFDLASGAVVGVEALVRWPAGGGVPPGDFVPVAETSGLIRAIGAFVVEEGCRVAARLARKGLAVPLSLNVSPAQLRRPEMAEQVEHALDRHGVRPELLELEVTEGLFVDPQQAHIRRNLARLHALGVRFALDDFGSGYSALAYLKNLPAERIKVDRSFVVGLGRDPADEAVLGAIVELGRVFGKRILAEGVETEDQRRVLVERGCDEAQGYLFARPMPEEELLAFLAARPRAAGRGAPAAAGHRPTLSPRPRPST